MKHTLATLELLEQNIDRLAEEGIYEIERDLLLERLRGLYASALAIEAMAEEERVLDALMGLPAGAVEVTDVEPEIEIERFFADPEDEYVGAPAEEEVTTESELEEEMAEDETAAESQPEELYEDEPSEEELYEEEPAVEEFVEEELVVEVAPDVDAVEEEPAVEEAPVAPAYIEVDHKTAMSLYDDDDDDELPVVFEDDEPVEEPTEEAVNEEETEPEEEQFDELELPEVEEDNQSEEGTPVVLGEALRSEQTTVADNLADQSALDVASAASATVSLRRTIGINDKYILMRDLFAGNSDYYESAISRLDEFDNLDEAMLYIYDNFHWSPNSEGARLLMELLARKLF